MIRLAAFIAAAAVGISCGQPCYRTSRALTGDFARDLEGTWGYSGIDTIVVNVFDLDGGHTEYSHEKIGGWRYGGTSGWSSDGGVFVFAGSPETGPVEVPHAEIVISESEITGFGRLSSRLSCPDLRH